MAQRVEALPNQAQHLRIATDVLARKVFGTDVDSLLDDLAFPDRSCALVSGHRDELVGWVSEPVGVYQGLIGHGGGGDGDVAA